MERGSEERKRQLLADCQVDPVVFAGMEERLQEFLTPFAERLTVSEQQAHARTFVGGLVSGLERKNVESIAYLHGEDRQPLQHFIGAAAWDHRPLLAELAAQVGRTLGTADAVLVFDPSGFVKKGKASVGVQRQWIGRVGKIDNGQVGVYLGYVTPEEHTLVDMRLFLPREWTKDWRRCRKAGVPKGVRFQTRHALALAMLDEQGPRLPHAWIAGDDEMGRSTRFRGDLRDRHERYLLAVPSNTLIRDLDATLPTEAGRRPKSKPPWTRVDAWRAALPQRAWTRLEVRDGAKGPLTVEIAVVRVQAKTEKRCVGPEEVCVAIRTKDESGVWKNDYYLSNASFATPRAEFARVANAAHRIEECLHRAKGETGLADYEVRTWQGWHHHQTLALLAVWFLVQETRR